jgi:hypothetical protein
MVGVLLVALGCTGLYWSIGYTPDQLANIVDLNPGWFLNPFYLLPAPEYFRPIGFGMIGAGWLLILVKVLASDP